MDVGYSTNTIGPEYFTLFLHILYASSEGLPYKTKTTANQPLLHLKGREVVDRRIFKKVA
jgi:hypothetical protein